MTLYEAIQYLKYKWKAKGRHGTHSPFVYAFIEEVLMNAKSREALMKNIKHYFQFREILECAKTQDGMLTFLPASIGNLPEDSPRQRSILKGFNRLYIFKPETTNPLIFKELLLQMKAEDVLLIMPLYTTKDHNSQWEVIKNDQKVRLSMDLFDMGLLFFREEFKEKQAFALKY